MKDQEINSAIAEACGWVRIRDHRDVGLIGSCPSSHREYNSSLDLRSEVPLPTYTTDLNAMHEAEAALKPEQRIKRVQQLCIICDRDYGGELMPSDVMSPIEMTSMFLDCTARQRAEAFLRALNKWKE